MSQDLYQFGAKTLTHLDRGAAAAALDKAVRMAVADCMDRPSDDRKRIVRFELDLVPVREVTGQTVSCEGARGTYKVTVKVPPWESNELDFGVRQNGVLVFSENSPGNHRQPALFDEEDES